MDNLLINSVISLGATGIVAASILFVASKKFKVEEDPRIDLVDEALPAANCGGCGFPGCRQFAEACTKAEDLSKLNCPVGGNDCMQAVAEILGMVAEEKEPLVAVLRCNGTKENAPAKVKYDGCKSCKSAHSLHAGDSGCQYGCLSLGDCDVSCPFDAITMSEQTGLPVVDEDLCTACGACVTACPRDLFELRPKGPDSQRVFVACMNKEKGAVARKNCKVACIGCTKCTKITGGDEVKVTSFLSYMDHTVNPVLHGPELIACCPTNSILGVNVEAKKPEPKTTPQKG